MNNRFTEQDKEEMRRLYKKKDMTLRKIAAIFKTDQSVIWYAVHKRRGLAFMRKWRNSHKEEVRTYRIQAAKNKGKPYNTNRFMSAGQRRKLNNMRRAGKSWPEIQKEIPFDRRSLQRMYEKQVARAKLRSKSNDWIKQYNKKYYEKNRDKLLKRYHHQYALKAQEKKKEKLAKIEILLRRAKEMNLIS